VAGLLQNKGSPLQTPASLLTDVHYAKLNIVRRWNWDRFNRLAAFLQLTHGELASLICLPHSQLPGIRKRNVFPGPVALLLTLLEAQVLAQFSNDIIAQPFPPNASSSHPQEIRPDAGTPA
jgi:hypothetical protein